jgi:hypothetical protein
LVQARPAAGHSSLDSAVIWSMVWGGREARGEVLAESDLVVVRSSAGYDLEGARISVGEAGADCEPGEHPGGAYIRPCWQ